MRTSPEPRGDVAGDGTGDGDGGGGDTGDGDGDGDAAGDDGGVTGDDARWLVRTDLEAENVDGDSAGD
eukprot:12953325-Alexandrium_andersonii.AAC.1